MDHAAGEAAKGSLRLGGDLADGLVNGYSAGRARLFHSRRGYVVGAV